MRLSIFQRGLLVVLLPFVINLLWIGLFWQSLQSSSLAVNRVADESRVLLLISRSIAFYNKATISVYEFVKTVGAAAARDRGEEALSGLQKALHELETATAGDAQTSSIVAKVNQKVSVLAFELRAIGAESEVGFSEYLNNMSDKRFVALMVDLHALLDVFQIREKALTDALDNEENERGKTRLIAFMGLGLNLLVALLLVYFMQRSIVSRVAYMAQTARGLAKQDLVKQDAQHAAVGRGDELAELERELIEAGRRLQEAYRFRREFMDVVALRLQTELQACIQTSLKLESELAGRDVPAAGERALRSMRSGASSCLSLIDDMVLLNSLESGLCVSPRPTELRLLVEEACKLVVHLATSKDVLLENKVDDCRLDMDGARMQQVLVNLIANAIKFSPRGAAVIVKSEFKPGWVRLSVTDAGPGIDQEARARLFQKFVQGASGKAAGGTGLGLSIARLIVEAHHGRIGVESSGKGSKFWFELPLST